MADQILSKSYTVIVKRQDQWFKLETLAELNPAVALAKQNISDKKNEEIRVVENRIDPKTRKEKQQVVKIFTQDKVDEDEIDRQKAAEEAARQEQISSEDARRRFFNNISWIVILLFLLVAIGGILTKYLLQYWDKIEVPLP